MRTRIMSFLASQSGWTTVLIHPWKLFCSTGGRTRRALMCTFSSHSLWGVWMVQHMYCRLPLVFH
jgi:hypothetical protein